MSVDNIDTNQDQHTREQSLEQAVEQGFFDDEKNVKGMIPYLNSHAGTIDLGNKPPLKLEHMVVKDGEVNRGLHQIYAWVEKNDPKFIKQYQIVEQYHRAKGSDYIKREVVAYALEQYGILLEKKLLDISKQSGYTNQADILKDQEVFTAYQAFAGQLKQKYPLYTSIIEKIQHQEKNYNNLMKQHKLNQKLIDTTLAETQKLQKDKKINEAVTRINNLNLDTATSQEIATYLKDLVYINEVNSKITTLKPTLDRINQFSKDLTTILPTQKDLTIVARYNHDLIARQEDPIRNALTNQDYSVKDHAGYAAYKDQQQVFVNKINGKEPCPLTIEERIDRYYTYMKLYKDNQLDVYSNNYSLLSKGVDELYTKPDQQRFLPNLKREAKQQQAHQQSIDTHHQFLKQANPIAYTGANFARGVWEGFWKGAGGVYKGLKMGLHLLKGSDQQLIKYDMKHIDAMANTFSFERFQSTGMNKQVVSNGKLSMDRDNTVNQVGQQAANMLLLLSGGGAASKGLQGLGMSVQLAAKIGLMTSAMSMQTGQLFDTAIQAGLSPKESLGYALVQGGMSAGLELISPNSAFLGNFSINAGKLFTAANKTFVVQFCKNIGKQIGEEIIQEEMQLIAEKGLNSLFNGSYGKQLFEDKVTLAEIYSTVILTGLTTGLMQSKAKYTETKINHQMDTYIDFINKHPSLKTQQIAMIDKLMMEHATDQNIVQYYQELKERLGVVTQEIGAVQPSIDVSKLSNFTLLTTEQQLNTSPADMTLDDFISMDSKLQGTYLAKHFNNGVELSLDQFGEQYTTFVETLISKYPADQQARLREEYVLEKKYLGTNETKDIQPNLQALNEMQKIGHGFDHRRGNIGAAQVKIYLEKGIQHYEKYGIPQTQEGLLHFLQTNMQHPIPGKLNYIPLQTFIAQADEKFAGDQLRIFAEIHKTYIAQIDAMRNTLATKQYTSLADFIDDFNKYVGMMDHHAGGYINASQLAITPQRKQEILEALTPTAHTTPEGTTKNQYDFSPEIQTENSLNSDNLIDENGVINPDAVVHLETFLRVQNVLGANESLSEDQIRKIYEVHTMERKPGETDDKQLNNRKGLMLRGLFTFDQIRVMMEGKVCGMMEGKNIQLPNTRQEVEIDMNTIEQQLLDIGFTKNEFFDGYIDITQISENHLKIAYIYGSKLIKAGFELTFGDIKNIPTDTSLLDNAILQGPKLKNAGFSLRSSNIAIIPSDQTIIDNAILWGPKLKEAGFYLSGSDIAMIPSDQAIIDNACKLQQSGFDLSVPYLVLIPSDQTIIDNAILHGPKLKNAGFKLSYDNINKIPNDETLINNACKLKVSGFDLSVSNIKNIPSDQTMINNMCNLKTSGFDLSISNMVLIPEDQTIIDNAILWGSKLKDAGFELKMLDLLTGSMPTDKTLIENAILHGPNLKKAGFLLFIKDIAQIPTEQTVIENACKLKVAKFYISISDIAKIPSDQAIIDNAILWGPKLKEAGFLLFIKDIAQIPTEQTVIENACKLKVAKFYISISDIAKIPSDQMVIKNACKLKNAGFDLFIDDINKISSDQTVIDNAILNRPKFKEAGFYLSASDISKIPTDQAIIDNALFNGPKLKEAGFYLSASDIAIIPSDQTIIYNAINYYNKTTIIEQFKDIRTILGINTIKKFNELLKKFGKYESVEFQKYLTNVIRYYTKVKDFSGFSDINAFEVLYLGRKIDIDEYLIQLETATQLQTILNEYSSSPVEDSYVSEVLNNYQQRLPELIALYAAVEVDESNRFSDESKSAIKELMEQGEGKTLSYAYMDTLVKNIYASSGTSTSMIDDVLRMHIDETGFGNLGFVETLTQHANALQKTFDTNKFPETKKELSDLGVRLRENNKKRSQDTINNVYNIATEILQIAPSLYTTIVSGMIEMKSSDLNYFIEHIYPLYHVELILHTDIQKTPRELVSIRNNIKTFFSDYKNNSDHISMTFTQEQSRMNTVIKELFQSRFGIIKVPDQFTEKHIDTIKNHALYLANMNGKEEKNEALLGFYLALHLHSKRDDFRAGVQIDHTQYVNADVSEYIQPYLAGRATAENIKEQKKLQSHELSQLVGDATTIDIVLHTINESVHQLLDPDLYTGNDKVLLETLIQYKKEVGGALAMQFQVLSGKISVLSPLHQEIISSIEHKTGTSLQTIEGIKNMQQDVKGLSPIINMVHKVQEIDILGKIDNLKQLLIPKESLMQLFSSWGVEMNQGSSVLASLDDVQYLRALANKHQDTLSQDQKKEIESYLDTIDQKLVEMYTDKDLIQNMFINFEKQIETGNNLLLKARIKELSPIFLQTNTSSKNAIISELTTDLNTVIKNIRACLACKEKGVNNDTNLTFGDTNKFFVISHNNANERSYADQLVHLLDTNQGKSFVMDLMYGKSIPDVLTNHIFTVCNKLNKLDNNAITAFVPDKVMKQSALTIANLQEKISEQYGDQFIVEPQSLNVTIPTSGAGDGYYEFLDKEIGRVTGTHTVSGWVIKRKN